ncbi:MAG: class I SAM-dependent methyltransferase [Candidatus Adiutrix sp.]|jgi:SAM-dependent methyltransferase|nr:class I SAM-dependent methyltransferase [Candidatus Adiutrix sp.]
MKPDCHDYFIKDGRHLGLYEEMYLICPDPWRIEELGPRLDMRAALLLLNGREKSVRRFLDIGAGLGLFTSLLTQCLWRSNPEARGLVTDIAPSAVARAQQRLADPRLEFAALDIRTLADKPRFPPENFDLLVLAQVLWGLLEDLPRTLAALADLLPAGGLMLISQHFFPPGRQAYGAETVAGPEELISFLKPAGLEILETIECNRAVNHHWAALAHKKAL